MKWINDENNDNEVWKWNNENNERRKWIMKKIMK